MAAEGPVADLGSQLLGTLGRGALVLVAAAGVGLVLTARSRAESGVSVRLARRFRTRTEEPAVRLRLRVILGVLWIVDGLLQAQPDMPAGFVAQVLGPGRSAGPSWLSSMIDPLARAWTAHPVAADAATVWIQLGLGVLILLGPAAGPLYRPSLIASIGWSIAVWVLGEALGGLTAPGASWLIGSPGAVLLYAGLAGLLLSRPAPEDDLVLAARSRRLVGAWFLLGAALQLLPWEQNFTAEGLSAPFRQAATHAQPALLLGPIRAARSLAEQSPVAVNLLLILLLAGLGLRLLRSGERPVLVAATALCLLTWWLAQDLGVIGGFGTDPNAGLPLAMILLAGWPAPSAGRQRARRQLPASALLPLSMVGLAALIAVPLLSVPSLFGPADAAAVTADSGGGVLRLTGRPAPAFDLLDQNGHRTSLATVRGSLVLVTFLDPVCSDDCPVIANQIAAAIRQLGPRAADVQVVAIDTNPVFHNVADVAAFTTSHGLQDLPGWHFVAGPEPSLRAVLDSYGVAVQVPSVGMIAHDEGIYFLDRTGAETAYLGDGADPNLSTGYATAIRTELSRLLG